MPIKREAELRTEGSPEIRRDRVEHSGKDTVVAPSVETRSTTPDRVAIEAARARALATGVKTSEMEQAEDRPIFNFATRARDTAVGVGKGGLKVMGGSLLAFGYLGYQISRPVLFTAAHALDWIGHKMNSLADKMIDKKIPILSWILNPMISVLDSFAKKLGIDKRLAEHLKKNAEDRKKVADKVFKDYMATQKTAEKKVDDKEAKAKRRKVIEDKFGADVADAIEGDVDAAAAAASPKVDSAPTPVPAETPKAA